MKKTGLKLKSRLLGSKARSIPLFIGIEGGATHTTAVLMDSMGKILKRTEAGPCNLQLIEDRDMILLWKKIKRDLTIHQKSLSPQAVGTFLAGCLDQTDRVRTLRNLKQVWPHAHHVTGNDTHSALAAALGNQDGMVLICGTGSNIRARRGGKSILVGGWGHIGGDLGSGYWMGHRLTSEIFRAYDRKGFGDSLTTAALHFLGLNTIKDLVLWSLKAHKEEIASLTKVLFHHIRNPLAQKIIKEATHILVEEVALAARKAGFRSSKLIHVAIHAGLAKYQPLFYKRLSFEIRRRLKNARVFLSKTEGAIGAACLAAEGFIENSDTSGEDLAKTWRPWRLGTKLKTASRKACPECSRRDAKLAKRNLSQALTEQRNPRTFDLDCRSIPQLIQTMLNEESRTIPAIRTQIKPIARAIQWIVSAFKQKGRLFYIGAGTSGRVGVLDASECPPTFGCDPEMVQGIIAGGWRALFQSIEAAEDDTDYGRQTVRDRGLTKKDILVGITASGSTPFALGALEEAHRLGAKTILLTFNPHSAFRIPHSAFLRIAIPTGPEVLAGSTRLKAGTATKLVLNMFTTLAMIRLGKVRSNLMVDLDPTCEKLHDRAARIYSILKKASFEEAWRRLEKNGWNLKKLLGRK